MSYKSNKLTDEFVDEFLKFSKAAADVCETRGTTYIFTCPLCEGEAQASKSSYNGHLHASCSKCGMRFMQ